MRLLHIAILCLVVTLALAPPALRWDAFDWPSDAERMLQLDYPRRFGAVYTESQADELLSNALPYLRTRSRGGFGLLNAGFMPRHRFVTHGVDEEDASRRSRASWFSVPLLASPDGTGRSDYVRMTLPGAGSLRSPDLIRFDRFQPRVNTGFWVPTAIVRPHFEAGPSPRLVFSVVHQFPTSPVMFRDAFRINPVQAQESLSNALHKKEGVWLAKLPMDEQNMIQRMWSRAPYSGLMQSSTFFDDAQRHNWGSLRRLRQALRTGRAASLEDGSSNVYEGPPMVYQSMKPDESVASTDGVDQHGAVAQPYHAAGASTSERKGEGQPVEHDFFGPGPAIEHVRPQTSDWWQHVPARQGGRETSRGKEPEVNLDLSLGRSLFGARRDP